MPRIERLTGCLIGQCLGDALGFPIEGWDGDACREFVDTKISKWFQGKVPPVNDWNGQYTDDSQLARELLESLVEQGGFAPKDYAGRIARIFRENKIVGRGLACDDAARRLIEGVGWREAGCDPPAAGNGTAMRAAPVGMFYYDDPAKMIQIAHEQGWITHHDPRCSAGSVAIAGGTALALTGEKIDTDEYANQVAAWMDGYHKTFADYVRRLPEWVELSPSEAVTEIAHAGEKPGYVSGWPGISPYVIPSVLWSLYAFLKYPDSYFDAIAVALAVGGDVDTTAAMTGALSGAYLGIDGMPRHLAEMVNDDEEWGYRELARLAEKCREITSQV